MSSEEQRLDRYKVPRESVDVEALAQQMSRYTQIAAEDAEYLIRDPARINKVVAELRANPGAKPKAWSDTFVDDHDDPYAYIDAANAEIEKLTPPKSFEDRVIRNHLATVAGIAFQTYRVNYAIIDYHDLKGELHRHLKRFMDEWHDPKLPIPSLGGRYPYEEPLLSSPASGWPAERIQSISEDEINEYMKNPASLIGKQFMHTPPADGDPDEVGVWRPISYAVRMVEGIIDHEYEVELEELEGDSVPMDVDNVRLRLQHSQAIIA